jgi:hypothetical protein
MEDEETRKRDYEANLEFWKATYDFFKHAATISLLSIAAFAALLGGAFKTPPTDVANSMLSFLAFSSWATQFITAISEWRSILVLITFLGFTASGYCATRGMHNSRTALWDSRHVTSKSQFREMKECKHLLLWRWLLGLSYSVGMISFFIITALSIKVR